MIEQRCPKCGAGERMSVGTRFLYDCGAVEWGETENLKYRFQDSVDCLQSQLAAVDAVMREVARLAERREVVELCRCCVACEVWHRFVALAGGADE